MRNESLIVIVLTIAGLLGVGLAVVSPVVSAPATCAIVAATLAAISVIGLSMRNRVGLRSADRTIAALRKNSDELNAALQAAQTRLGDMTLTVQLLQQRKSSTEAILNSIRDAVLVTDDRDRIILANNAAETLFGFRFDPNARVLAADLTGIENLLPLIRKSRAGRIAHVRHEIAFVCDGESAVFDAVLSCSEDDAGRVSAVVAVLHDITREKEVAQMKNDFVSHVSHELKTPLASINAYAEMLVDGEAQDEETMHQFCSVIQGQAQRLTRLIDDILNISRIESGLIKVSKDNHSMALIIRDAVEMIKSYAQEKNIALNAQAPILCDQVYIDRDMLSQVVINLLSNAVKYTPAGGSIAVSSEVNDADNRITVTVADTGVGIPPEAVERVFDKFYRVEANNKYAKGTGLGLNLVRQIVETVHGGRVFVTSTVGKGSVFGFELPLAAETVKC
jgi:two-component system phosphate regulon sensor histidine kinase PhoR